MEKSLYFIKRGHSNHHRNGLEESIAKSLQKFDKMLTDCPQEIGKQIRNIVLMRNQANKRCKPATFTLQASHGNKRDFTATVIGLGGSTVWTAIMYEVVDTCYENELQPEPTPASKSATPAPVPAKQAYSEGQQLRLL